MDQLKSHVIAVLLGVALAWASVFIAGIGAAVAIPAEVLKPIAQMSGLLALALVDLFTIAIPLAAALLVLAFASKLVVKKPDATFYVLLLAPLVVLQLYFLVQAQPHVLNTMMPTLPRYVLLAVCFYFLVRSTKPASADNHQLHD